MGEKKEVQFALGFCLATFGWYLVVAESFYHYAGKENLHFGVVLLGLALFVAGIALWRSGLSTSWIRAISGSIGACLGITGSGFLLRAATIQSFDNTIYWLSWIAIMLALAILFAFRYFEKSGASDDHAT